MVEKEEEEEAAVVDSSAAEMRRWQCGSLGGGRVQGRGGEGEGD